MTSSRPVTIGPRWWIWGLGLVPLLVVALVQWRTAPPGEITDVYQYLLHARALAEGRGYTDTGYIFSDFVPWVGPVARPPGLPLTLLPLYKLFGPVMILMQLVVFVSTLAYVVLAGRYFSRVDSWYLGVGVALLVGLVPRFPGLSMQLLNDLPFCFLFWLTIRVVDAEGEFDTKRALAVTVLAGAAVGYRLAGAALVPALVLYGVLRFRDRGWAVFAPPVILGGLAVIALAVTDVGIPSWVTGTDWHPGALVAKFGGQVLRYRLGLIQTLLYPWPGNVVNDIYHLIAVVVMLIGLGLWLPRAWRSFGFCAAVAYALMLLALPATQSRYLWPLVPFVMYGMLRGAVFLLERVPGFLRAYARPVVLSTAGVIAVLTSVNELRHPLDPPLVDDPAIQDVIAWIAPLAPDRPRVAFYKPRLLSWETRVSAMALPLVADTTSSSVVVEEFQRQGITHVVTQRPEQHLVDASSVLRAIREHPGRFEELRRNAVYIAYRFRLEG